MPERKSMSQERYYASTAAAVTAKQHWRLHDQAEAIVQATGWMRECDLTLDEVKLRQAALILLGREGKVAVG